MMPRKNASVATRSTRVTSPTSGPFSKLDLAAGARLKPISATIAPVTTGGSVTSIQCVPTTCTMTPMTISTTPTATKSAERAAGAVRGDGRGHRRDHREARAQIARQPVAGDDQEQHRADAGEQQGGRGREAGQHRHQEGGAEHRHDVLGADADGAGPAQSFVGGDDEVVVRSRSTCFHVSGITMSILPATT